MDFAETADMTNKTDRPVQGRSEVGSKGPSKAFQREVDLEASTKTLIVAPSWISDIVLSHALIQIVHQSAPDPDRCLIDVLAPNWSRGLFARMPEISQVIDMPLGHGKIGLGLRRQLGQQLKHQHYTHSIVLPNTFKSAIVPFAAQVPHRTGWRGEMRYALLNDLRVLKESKYEHLYQRYVALALKPEAPLPAHVPNPNLEQGPPSRIRQQLGQSQRRRKTVAVVPRAYASDSTLGTDYFSELSYAQLIAGLLDQGADVWLFGTSKQQRFLDLIKEHLGERLRKQWVSFESYRDAPSSDEAQIVEFCGLPDALDQLMDLFGEVDAVITDDQGLKLVAVALKRPTFALELNPGEERFFRLPNTDPLLVSISSRSQSDILQDCLALVSAKLDRQFNAVAL